MKRAIVVFAFLFIVSAVFGQAKPAAVKYAMLFAVTGITLEDYQGGAGAAVWMDPLKIRAASDPGEYEVRYVLARGNRLLAKAPLTVNPVTAEVQPPATAAVGAELVVRWRGPGYAEDFVSIARANQPAAACLSSNSVRKGNPLKLSAPKEPGTYEVRYVLGRGNRLLAKATIEIKAP